MSVLRVVKKFKNILSAHQRLRIFELILLMVIGAVLEMCTVSLVLPFMEAVMNPSEIMGKWYIKQICDVTGVNTPSSILILYAVALAIMYLLKNAYLIFEYSIQYRFVYGNMFSMQQRLLRSYIYRPYEYFLRVNSAEIVRIINTDTPNTFAMLSTILNLFTELVVTVMLIAAVFFISPFVTICIAFLLLVLLMIINGIIKPILRKEGMENQKSGTGMNKWLLQSIQGIKELKVMSKEVFFLDKFSHYGERFVISLRMNYILGIIPRFLVEAIGMGVMFLSIAILLCCGSRLENIVPILSAVAMAAVRLMPSVNRMSVALTNISYNEPMLDKLIENLKDINGIDRYQSEEKIVPGTGKIGRLQNEIFISHISYHYPESEKEIFVDASMKICKGEAVGIVGSSGAGKSTSVDIILGLLHPQKGRIFIDGTDICVDMKAWLHQIGYIPQMIFMLDDTIRANVAFGVPKQKISDKDVWRALQEASLEDFVRSLDKGLDTEIGERGVRLSGGQRQRIGIARALYQNPEVLIFDEATSALDNETEASIIESVNKLQGQKTLIIIAHRLTTIKNCDRVYRIGDKKITQESV